MPPPPPMEIFVTYQRDKKGFTYIDENKQPAETKTCRQGEEIRWTFLNPERGERLVLEFTQNPFQGAWPPFENGHWYKFLAKPASEYKYNVVLLKNKTEIARHDPQVHFDDLVSTNIPGLLPDVITKAVEDAWEKIVSKLRETPPISASGHIDLYPHGVTTIEVEVNVTGVLTVRVKVSGPEK